MESFKNCHEVDSLERHLAQSLDCSELPDDLSDVFALDNYDNNSRKDWESSSYGRGSEESILGKGMSDSSDFSRDQIKEVSKHQEAGSPFQAPFQVGSPVKCSVPQLESRPPRNAKEVLTAFSRDQTVTPFHFKKFETKDQEALKRYFKARLTDANYQKLQYCSSSNEKETLVFDQPGDFKEKERDDGALKQVFAAAFSFLKKAFKRHFELQNSKNELPLKKKICEVLFKPEKVDVTDELAEKVFSYKAGVTKKYLSAITMNGQNLNLLRRLIDIIESEAATDLYFQKKVVDQLERALAGKKNLPFEMITKQIKVKGKARPEAKETIAKIPVTRVEFRDQCKKAVEKLQEYCKKKWNVGKDLLKPVLRDTEFEYLLAVLTPKQTDSPQAENCDSRMDEEPIPPYEAQESPMEPLSPKEVASLPSTPKKMPRQSPGAELADRKAKLNSKAKESIANRQRKQSPLTSSVFPILNFSPCPSSPLSNFARATNILNLQ